MRLRRESGFTLVELLAAVGVLAVLVGLLVPALGAAKERSRRLTCMNNVRRFTAGLHLYAQENMDRLVSGQSDYFDPQDEHTPVISTVGRGLLVRSIGGDDALMCPSMQEPFTQPGGWYYDGYGYVMGYNYLGGHGGTPWALAGQADATWVSPQRMTEESWRPLVTDLNAWTTAGDQTWAPHAGRGSVLLLTGAEGGGQTAAAAGATGGNVGLLDGSVGWKGIGEMRTYVGSRMHGGGGCTANW